MKASQDDFNAFVEADFSFHVAIAKAARNRILLNALELMLNMKRQWIDRRLKGTGMEPFAIKHHQEILQAIVDRDQERASAAMAEHLDLVGLGGIEEATTVILPALAPENHDGDLPSGKAGPSDTAPLSAP
jgi:DNA-binding FadR family transcriptional regulator